MIINLLPACALSGTSWAYSISMVDSLSVRLKCQIWLTFAMDLMNAHSWCCLGPDQRRLHHHARLRLLASYWLLGGILREESEGSHVRSPGCPEPQSLRIHKCYMLVCFSILKIGSLISFLLITMILRSRPAAWPCLLPAALVANPCQGRVRLLLKESLSIGAFEKLCRCAW